MITRIGRKLALAVILSVSAVTVAPASAGAGSRAVAVWEDPAGDADIGQGAGSVPGGFDLVTGAIARKGRALEFSVLHADMPPSGTLPEGFRFLWTFEADGKTWRLSIKSADIGKPDVAQGQTTERVGRVDLEGQFRLEGMCETTTVGVQPFVNCKPIAYLDGSFDPSKATLTMLVPLKSIGAGPGSIVQAGAAGICTICWVPHFAERSPADYTIDDAVQTKAYRIPHK